MTTLYKMGFVAAVAFVMAVIVTGDFCPLTAGLAALVTGAVTATA